MLLFGAWLTSSWILHAQRTEIPRTISGIEVFSIKGWWANHYLWPYLPDKSTVHPLPGLHQPDKHQTPEEMLSLIRILKQYGSGLDVIQYNPNPESSDHNQLLSSGYLTHRELTNRPFFLSYEHANGTRFKPADDNGIPKDMNDPHNRQVFREDIDWMVRQIILPNQSRYVTFGGRALIYLWSVAQMSGDFASLLDEMRAAYPVAFLGSVNSLYLPNDLENSRSFRSLDGFMEYALFPTATSEEKVSGVVEYSRMKSMYAFSYFRIRSVIKRFEEETKRKYLLVPTMQFAFDDTKWPGRKNTPMYPKSRAEAEAFAKLLRDSMDAEALSPVGPFQIINEYFEGNAAAPSRCLQETFDTPSRFIGCGLARLEILKKYF